MQGPARSRRARSGFASPHRSGRGKQGGTAGCRAGPLIWTLAWQPGSRRPQPLRHPTPCRLDHRMWRRLQKDLSGAGRKMSPFRRMLLHARQALLSGAPALASGARPKTDCLVFASYSLRAQQLWIGRNTPSATCGCIAGWTAICQFALTGARRHWRAPGQRPPRQMAASSASPTEMSQTPGLSILAVLTTPSSRTRA